jgi:hypothetical protein
MGPKNSAGKSKGKNGVNYMPQPITSVAVERKLTLQDLPEEEKAKMARVVERLVNVVREKDDLKGENDRLTAELDGLTSMKQEAEKAMEEATEAQLGQQAGRATAMGMLHLYQKKTIELADQLRAAEKCKVDATEKCATLEKDIQSLEALVQSQQNTLAVGKGALELRCNELETELTSSQANLKALEGTAEMLSKTQIDMNKLKEQLKEREVMCEEYATKLSQAITTATEASRAATRRSLEMDMPGTVDEVGERGSTTVVETEGDREEDQVNSEPGIERKELDQVEIDRFNTTLLNASLTMNGGSIPAHSLSPPRTSPPAPPNKSPSRLQELGLRKDLLKGDGMKSRRDFNMSREVLQQNISLLRESLQSADWSTDTGGDVGSDRGSLEWGRAVLLARDGIIQDMHRSRSSMSGNLSGSEHSGQRSKSGSPYKPTRPGPGKFGQPHSPLNVPNINRNSPLLKATTSSKTKIAQNEQTNGRIVAFEEPMPWGAGAGKGASLTKSPKRMESYKQKDKNKKKIKKTKKEMATQRALAKASRERLEGRNSGPFRVRGSRMAERRILERGMRLSVESDVTGDGIDMGRGPPLTHALAQTLKNSTDSLLAAPSGRTASGVQSPQRSIVSVQSSYSLSREKTTSRRQRHPPALSQIANAGSDKLYDASLFELVEDLNL